MKWIKLSDFAAQTQNAENSDNFINKKFLFNNSYFFLLLKNLFREHTGAEMQR